jgi:hypothetical protein
VEYKLYDRMKGGFAKTPRQQQSRREYRSGEMNTLTHNLQGGVMRVMKE